MHASLGRRRDLETRGSCCPGARVDTSLVPMRRCLLLLPLVTAVQHRGEDCLHECNGQGACASFCGSDGACCKVGFTDSPAACGGGLIGCQATHCCVEAQPIPPPPPPFARDGGDCFEACPLGVDQAFTSGGLCSVCDSIGMPGACCRWGWETLKHVRECGFGVLGCDGRHCCTAGRTSAPVIASRCADPFAEEVGSSPTVAYAFLTRDTLPLWPVWEAYFAGCPAGTALPIIHSQESTSDPQLHAALAQSVARFGGFVLSASETRTGGTRFKWRMISIMLSLMRAALRTPAASGCHARWIHFASERDAPLRSCVEVHEHLKQKRGFSFLDQTHEGIEIQGSPGVPYSPLKYTSQWVTLTIEAARSLVADESRLRERWGGINHGVRMDFPNYAFGYGAVDECGPPRLTQHPAAHCMSCAWRPLTAACTARALCSLAGTCGTRSWSTAACRLNP